MSRFVELTGSRIHFDDTGRGDVVLLLHGLGLDLRMWDAQVPVLAERYRVVRLDLHGFGKSSGITGPYSHGDLIGELLEHLEIERAHVVLKASRAGELELGVVGHEDAVVVEPHDGGLLGEHRYRDHRA